jgi:ubiquinone/menaquinone biosynthesis C-methylase UbiE
MIQPAAGAAATESSQGKGDRPMKRAELFHPRVFDDETWALTYHKRNRSNIRRMGGRLAELLEKSGFTDGRILDAGCGFGAVTIELAKRFPRAEIQAVDLGRPLLNLAEKDAQTAGVADRISFGLGDVHQLDFEDHAFDLTVNTFMLHVVEHPVRMLAEIERVTGPGGRILITDLRRIWLGLVVKKLKTAFTLDEARQVIEKSSLRPGRYGKGPFWWDYFVGV